MISEHFHSSQSQISGDAISNTTSGTPLSPPTGGRRARHSPQGDLSRSVAAGAALKAMIAEDPALAEDGALWLDMLEGETDLFAVLDRLLIEDLDDEGMIKGLAQVKEELAARSERLKVRRERRRALIEQALLILDVGRLERPLATLSLVSRPARIVIDDEVLIPSRFFVSKPHLDRTVLRNALTAGEEVPGARLESGVVSLTVRRR
jgi:hypothetical protein